VEIRLGDALQTLRTDLPGAIDLVLLDGAKALYPEILHLLESRLRPGAFIVADNADESPEYLARVRAPDSGYVCVAFGGDVELSMRLGQAPRRSTRATCPPEPGERRQRTCIPRA
jgi:precorrin-6B methylase 2